MTLFFVTDRVDAHVARFDALFASLSRDYELVRVTYEADSKPIASISGATHESWDAIRGALASEGALVVSGPLDTVSANLVEGSFGHVGISFATDVMVTAAQSSTELSRLRTLVESIDFLVTDNYATENALISMGATADKVLRIPWGPEKVGVSSMTRAECGWPADRRIVLYPRNLEPHYDPDVFVDAVALVAKQVPEVLAVFVEVGSLVHDTKERIASAGLGAHVHFEPLREPEEFRAMMACADVVVVTPRTDGTSVTVMDAMAQGVPVVSSLTAGSAEWVVEGITGWTFPVGNAPALASALERALVPDRSHRALVIEHAKTLVSQKAGWNSSAQRLGEVIHRLLAGH
ncbi:MAG TPA: glycosyltransferase family 4 protein [Pontimonas sp.]|nr:glycosyltransferase family 4 protein [Pontimonas sp.]